jgi:serine/threonine protein kinase
MNLDQENKQDIALRVSDGEPVDWDLELQKSTGEDENKSIAGMRILSAIAECHRESTHRWGHLEILEELGSGSFGTVFRARDTRLDRDVALKLVESGSENTAGTLDLIKEARLLARVKHPNVVTVFGAEEHDGQVGIWMDLLRGTTLADHIRNNGIVSPREAALIGVEICRALAAVHETGVVHRDIKAENVMQDDGGNWVLADFGSGRPLSAFLDDCAPVSGTPLYMAPEILAGETGTSTSDLYSLGVLLFHLVTASFPVKAASLAELKQAHREHRRELPRDARADLPDGFIRIVEKALSPEPDKRFRTAGEMETALSDWLSDRASKAQDRLRRGTLGWWVAAILLITAGLWYALQPDRTSLDFHASLVRLSPTGVSATLMPGGRVAPGDQVSLEVQTSQELWVYVINEDEAGHAYVLFPLPGLDQQNPLPGEGRYTLPGKVNGHNRYWTADTAGGREHFLVVASLNRQERFEKEMATLARPEMIGDQPMALNDEARRELARGFGQVTGLSGGIAGTNAVRLFELADDLNNSSLTLSGVQVRHLILENPIP